ncbi:MAG: STAS domain-containing protein [Anaerolineales bacterium]|nr:STAS domain-containing protein [Anaerolineales bacterium]
MSHYLQRPLRLFRTYDRSNFGFDLVAGITVAVVLLPQAVAFTIIAELPPEMGLYAAVVGAFFGALWGSSDQVHTGPANAISLLVLGTLSSIVIPGTNEYIVAAGVMAVMVGLFQLGMGLARLGILVNFVSHSVIVGFATGAGILIILKQIGPLLQLSYADDNLFTAVLGLAGSLPETHLPTAAIGIGTVVAMLLMRRFSRKLPAALLSMMGASILVYLLRLDQAGVAVIGELPRNLPPLADLPLLDLQLIARLSAGALAVGSIGLVETIAIARSIATQTGQRLDSNQEFVGQGMANLAAGLFSGYPIAGSFSRSAVNVESGAKTPMAAIFSAIFVLLAMFLLAPLAAYLPRAALAGVVILTGYGLIDRAEIGRIWRGAPGDAIIMMATLLGTLFLNLDFAVLAGILLSFALYIMRTSAPRVYPVLPDDDFRHFVHRTDVPECPQLAIIDVLGDLYFGAVNHVEEAILAHAAENPEQRFLILRMNRINHCDFSGIHMLEGVVRAYRERGGDVFVVRVSPAVQHLMNSTGFERYLGLDHFHSEDEIISHVFHRTLDPAVCIYECPHRAFRECQNLPKRVDVADVPRLADIPDTRIETIPPDVLWQQLRNGQGTPRPLVLDVREPREFRQGHIPDAELLPLPRLMAANADLPADRPIVLVCRGGRRSRRAAYVLQRSGRSNVAALRGGMLAWEAAGLLEAID